jgi:hypothetical protein
MGIETFLNRHIGKIESSVFAPVERMCEVNMPTGLLDQSADLIRQKCWPVVVSNHQSHADIFVLTQVVAGIMKKLGKDTHLKGFLMPAASSVKKGQDKLLERIYPLMGPWFNYSGIQPKLVRTEHDRTQRPASMVVDTTKSTSDLLKAPGTNFGIADFIAGTIDESRFRADNSGLRNGMREIRGRDLFSTVILSAYCRGQKVVVIPVAIDGTYNIISPYVEIPDEAKDAYKHNFLHPSSPRRLAQATLGEPITLEDYDIDPSVTDRPGIKEISRNNPQKFIDISNLTLARIASMLPPECQGDFRTFQI